MRLHKESLWHPVAVNSKTNRHHVNQRKIIKGPAATLMQLWHFESHLQFLWDSKVNPKRNQQKPKAQWKYKKHAAFASVNMRCSKWGAAAHTSNHEAKLQGMVNIFLFLVSLRAYPPGLLFQYLHRKPSTCCLENCTLIHTSQQHTSVVSSSIQTCTSSFSLQCQIQF